jgi:carbonic anhydrase/acetyltransferase-like protein (isoleucine patch superfamily)
MPTLQSLPSLPYRLLRQVIVQLPMFRFDRETRGTQTPATIEHWWSQNIMGYNRGPYWPVDRSSRVVGWQNILLGVETSPGLQGGCYIQGIGKIRIGDYTQIASNVGIISANHDLYDNRKHIAEEVVIGRYCWLGMGSVILPGVKLGDFTIVGANAVVTKSFVEGHCVLVGSPARKIKELDVSLCVRHRSPFEYHGFIRSDRFDKFRKANLTL